ncbi:MAG TPA: MBG domain-containing protein [Opitutaceae bacterium]|nr:MBG domain-containing protein [Opitutaceae bacterium]
MHSLVSKLAILSLVFAAPLAAAPTPAASSEAFLNLLGANTHLDGVANWNTNAAVVGQQMAYLGLRLERDWPEGTTADGAAFHLAQQQNPLMRLWTSINEASPDDQQAAFANCQAIYNTYGSGLVYAMGGPNEEDDPYPQGLMARLPLSAQLQQSLYDWANPRGIKVSQMEFGAGWTDKNNWQGDYNPTNPGINYTTPANGDQRYTPGQADFGGSHPYLVDATTTPGARLATLRALARLTTPGAPVANTEWGAYTKSGLSTAVFGQYMVMGAFDSAAAGDSAYILYGLQDGVQEGTYGFYTPDGTVNPVGTYFHTLTTILQCSKADLRYAPGQAATFAPGSLNLTSSNPGTVSHYLLQKPTGEFVVAAYAEQLMNGAQATASDTIDFGQTFASVTVYDVESGLTPIATLTNVSSYDLTLQPSDTYLLVLDNGTPPAPDFSLTVSPQAQTVTIGNTTSYAVTVGSLNGFASPVSLSVSGLPAGATATFSPATVAGAGSATLTVATGASATLGTNALVVSGTSGALTHGADVTLAINAPGAPPAPGGLTVLATNGHVALNWTAVGNAASYTVKRATTSDGPFEVVASGVTTATYMDNVAGDAAHYFTVSATNDSGESANAAPVAPTVIVDNADASGVAIVGTWATSSNATGFYGPDYRYTNGPNQSVRFTPTLVASNYVVSARWTANANRDANVPYDISYSGGTRTVYVNQQTNGGTWFGLGTFPFDAGSIDSVLLRTTGTSAVVVADAIEFVPTSNTPPAPDFSLALTPDSQGVTAGESVSYTVTSTAANGFTGTVDLSASGLPTGATATFSPATLTGSGTSTLTVVTTAGTPTGSSTLAVSATSGALAHAANATLVVNAQPTTPGAPSGLTAVAGDTQVTLGWTAVGGASSYTIKRTSASGGPYTTLRTGVTATAFTDGGLTNGNTYYYVVSAINGIGESGDSAEVSGTPQTLTLIKDNADATGFARTGSWATGTGVAGFYGTNYLSAGTVAQSGPCTATFTPTITVAGNYDVYARWTAAANRATNAPIDVNSAGGTTTVTVNEQANNGTWMLLGSYFFNPGTTGHVVVRNNGGANGYVVADAVRWVLQPAAAATLTLGNLSQAYDGTAKAVTVTTAPAGLATMVTYNGSPSAPAAAGSYAVVASVNTPSYQGSVSDTLVINPAPATVTLGDLNPTYDGAPKAASATTAPGGLAVAITYNGNATAPTNAGTYAVAASIIDPNYVGAASGTLTIAPAASAVSWNPPAAIVYGTALSAAQLDASANVPGSFSYTPSAGTLLHAGANQTLAVAFTPTDGVNYTPSSATVAITVNPAPAAVTLANLRQTYDGSPHPVTAATVPAGLPLLVTYNGSATAPINAGSYAVVASVTDPNYVGAASDTLVIGQADATIVLSPLTQAYDGTPRAVTATTTPAGLPVTLSYDGATAAPTYPGSYPVEATITDPNYDGSLEQTLEITITALVRHAPTLNGILDGSVQQLSAEDVTLNGGASVSGDLLLPGTPSVLLNGQPNYAGTVDGPGAESPTDYGVTLNGRAVLRHVVRRIGALALPGVEAPPLPTGIRDVTLDRATQTIGDFTTLRNLTLNGNVGAVSVPPGTYGTLVVNGGSSLVLGVAGATEPATYNLQGLTLNGNGAVQVVGPVIVTVANGVVLNASAGDSAHPEWLNLRVSSGGLTLNGAATFYGGVTAPSGAVTVNGNATLLGRVISDQLVLNGRALLSESAQ